MTLRYAVIPTRDRPQDFADCIAAIEPQVDMVIVVAHRCDYPFDIPGFSLSPTALYIARYDAAVPNISEMWNIGLDAAAANSQGPFQVAVLNDDVVVPPGWFEMVAGAMSSEGAVMAGPARDSDSTLVAGYAFVLDGRAGLRADEQFQWWYGDTDLHQQAVRAGGVLMLPQAKVEHRHPNSTTTGELAVIAGQDRERFTAKWGR